MLLGCDKSNDELAVRHCETLVNELLTGVNCADDRKRLVSFNGYACRSIDASSALDDAREYDVSNRLIRIGPAAAREHPSGR